MDIKYIDRATDSRQVGVTQVLAFILLKMRHYLIHLVMARVLRIFHSMLYVVSTESCMYSNKVALGYEGNYNVSYNLNASSDTLEFLLEARATGWVGFGVAETAPNNMSDYDVAVGGVLSNGTGYLKVS